MLIPTDQPTPTEPGHYFWKNSLGTELICVYRVPARVEWGVQWDECLCVLGRNVKQFQGTFSKRMTMTTKGVVYG